MPIRPWSRASVLCRACMVGQACTKATTGPRIVPAPRATGHGTGSTASTAMNIAPDSAMKGMTSIPFTQPAVAVERAIAKVRSRTRSADHQSPPCIEERAPPHTRPGTNCRRPLGDTDCISCPHQARKVIAAAHDVQVHVLAEVEARVLVGAAEAPDVEVEHDQSGAAAAHRLQ